MIFCGIEKSSLNDFPGKISCVIFTHGCNFFCPYCHNPQTVLSKYSNIISTKEVFTFIEDRKKFYDGVVISGGEPTLNQDLPIICEKIKKLGYHIKLDTNGSRPEMLIELLNNNMLDYVAMDLKTYPSEKLYKQFTNEPNMAISIKKSINLIMNKAPDYEFRTTCVHPFINLKIIERISNAIKGANRYIFQPFNKRASSILNEKFFANKKLIISQNDILNFVEIASSKVEHCSISML